MLDLGSLMPFVEKAINNNSKNPVEIVIPKNNSDNWILDKTLDDFFASLQRSNSPFLSELKTEEKIQLPEYLKSKINIIANELNFSNEIEGDIEKLMTKLYISNLTELINISKSNEGEFMVFIDNRGTYKNILVDEDGDVELLIIPQNRNRTYNKRFYKEDGLNFSKVVSTFNEMH